MTSNPPLKCECPYIRSVADKDRCSYCGLPIQSTAEPKKTSSFEVMGKYMDELGEKLANPSPVAEREGWIKEFERLQGDGYLWVRPEKEREVKSFITTLLHTEREKGRVEICGDRHQAVADKARAEGLNEANLLIGEALQDVENDTPEKVINDAVAKIHNASLRDKLSTL